MNVLDNEDKAQDFYQKLRAKIRSQLSRKKASDNGPDYDRFVETLAILPDFFHLAIRCVFDKAISFEHKGALVLAITYVVSPIDIIPDFVPIAGWLDDLVVITWALNKFLDLNNYAIKQCITKHWAGEDDVLDTIKHVLETSEAAIEFLPKRMLQTVRAMFA